MGVSMIVKLKDDTFRVQFIKEVESRRGGRTTITTICKIFKCVGKQTQSEGLSKSIWEECSIGVARQNPRDKYNHLIGKRVALQHAMFFDRTERSVFAQRLEKEFNQNA
jgi:hypothetical protein